MILIYGYVLSVPPMLWIPHQLIGAPVGFMVTVECSSEAHPASLNYWTREDGHMIHDSRKYRTQSEIGTPSYKTHMKLTIYDIQPKDFGVYKCVAKNPRGETDGIVRLYGTSCHLYIKFFSVSFLCPFNKNFSLKTPSVCNALVVSSVVCVW